MISGFNLDEMNLIGAPSGNFLALGSLFISFRILIASIVFDDSPPSNFSRGRIVAGVLTKLINLWSLSHDHEIMNISNIFGNYELNIFSITYI